MLHFLKSNYGCESPTLDMILTSSNKRIKTFVDSENE